MNGQRKLLLNKIKSEKKKKIKNINRIKQLEIELVKIKYVNNPNKLEYELKELKKIHIVGLNSQEIENDILRYTGEFEIVGSIVIGDQIRQTHIRFGKITDYEHYNNAIDEGYNAEHAIFNGYIYKNQHSSI